MELEMSCDRCPVSKTCPRNGSSPFFMGNGKRVHCRILGGFGRTPVDTSILSEESRARCAADGPCLTIAEVPTLDGEFVEHRVVKIFSAPVLGERERVTTVLGGQLNAKCPGD